MTDGSFPLPPAVEQFLKANPAAAIMGILVLAYLAAPSERPGWLKDCPRIHGPRNGAWRGKGSFGHGFGPNRVRHK